MAERRISNSSTTTPSPSNPEIYPLVESFSSSSLRLSQSLEVLPSTNCPKTSAVEGDSQGKDKRRIRTMFCSCSMNSTKVGVLLILCLQNSLFTILRRYSQGVLKEIYSKHEVLLVGEVIKIIFSAWMISRNLPSVPEMTICKRLSYLFSKSGKMFVLALIYGAMNILSYVSLRNIGAGIFTIFAQCKILTTATFSSILLRRQYSWARWRALVSLMMGVLLFTEPIWNDLDKPMVQDGGNALIGTAAVLIEVSLSGFASIYFEKVIKTDKEQLGIWERNFQLALGSLPVYILFIISNRGEKAGYAGGWSALAWCLAFLGAAGGLLVALSIKYGDSILKTLATTGAIILSSVLDHFFLGGPLTPVMCIAGTQVIIAIMNYTFDGTPVTEAAGPTTGPHMSPPPKKQGSFDPNSSAASPGSIDLEDQQQQQKQSLLGTTTQRK